MWLEGESKKHRGRVVCRVLYECHHPDLKSNGKSQKGLKQEGDTLDLHCGKTIQQQCGKGANMEAGRPVKRMSQSSRWEVTTYPGILWWGWRENGFNSYLGSKTPKDLVVDQISD